MKYMAALFRSASSRKYSAYRPVTLLASLLIAVWSRIVLSHRVPISGVAISLSIPAASFAFLVAALIEKLAPMVRVLHWLHAPRSMAGKLMMPSGEFSGCPPLAGGTKARPEHKLPLGHMNG